MHWNIFKRKAKRADTAESIRTLHDRKYGCKTLYDPSGAKVDIVLVHGLTGDRFSTWTTKTPDKVCWPRDLLPKEVPDARITVFGYDADVVNTWNPASQNTVNDHAQSFVNDLGIWREKDGTSDRPLILIGHSLGGLVIQEALLISSSSVERYRRKIHETTKAILFLGTPHCGTQIGSWAEFAGNIINTTKTSNKLLLSTLTPSSEVLAGIQDQFHTLLRRLKDERGIGITLVCFYEELYVSWIGKKVVPDTSAKLNGYLCEGIHANHMEMARFEDEEDPGFKKVANQIWRCMEEILEPKSTGAVRGGTPWEPSPNIHTSPGVGPSGLQPGVGPRGLPQGVGPIGLRQGNQAIGGGFVTQGDQSMAMGGNWT